MHRPSFEIFRHRQYARFWTARGFANLAVEMQTTAMGWQVYDAARGQGQSVFEAAFLLGLVGLAHFLPRSILSLFGGQAADRYNRRRILLTCIGAKIAIVSLLAFASRFEADIVIAAVFVAAFAAGATNAFQPPAASAMLPMLAPRELLPQAVAWSSLAMQGSTIVGPALGGLLYAFGPIVPYSVALALLGVALLMTFRIRPPAQQPPAQDARALKMIAEGLRFVWSNKVVLGAISLDLVVVLLAGAVALLPVFARDILHAGPAELGLLRSATGVGAAIVGLWLAIDPVRRRVGFWMFAATIVFGLATVAFGLSQWLWLTALALAVAGGADMISIYIRQTLIQLNTPDAMRGRVAAVSYVAISASNELGDFEAGLMARIFGPVLAVALGGVAAVAASLWWMRLFPELARADSFEPPPR